MDPNISTRNPKQKAGEIFEELFMETLCLKAKSCKNHILYKFDAIKYEGRGYQEYLLKQTIQEPLQFYKFFLRQKFKPVTLKQYIK